MFLCVSQLCLSKSIWAIELHAAKSQAELQAADLQHFVRDREIKLLETDDETFITLMKEQTTGFAKGIAFIVPEINQSIHRQAAISSLYDKLNDYGWTSLLLTMPSDINPVFGYDGKVIKKSLNTDSEEQEAEGQTAEGEEPDASVDAEATDAAEGQESAEQTASENGDAPPESQSSAPSVVIVEPETNPNIDVKAFHRPAYYSSTDNAALKQIVAKRMAAAWQLANEHPGFFLVICQGKSCNWLTELFLEQEELNPDALVMLSAHMPQSDLNDLFAEQLSKTEFPVLDLYQSSDNPWVLANVPWRRKLARKNYKTDYRQRQLYTGIDYYGQERRTIKEIYGFLTAVGM